MLSCRLLNILVLLLVSQNTFSSIDIHNFKQKNTNSTEITNIQTKVANRLDIKVLQQQIMLTENYGAACCSCSCELSIDSCQVNNSLENQGDECQNCCHCHCQVAQPISLIPVSLNIFLEYIEPPIFIKNQKIQLSYNSAILRPPQI